MYHGELSFNATNIIGKTQAPNKKLPSNLSTKYPIPSANSFVFIKYKYTFAFRKDVGSLGFLPF